MLLSSLSLLGIDTDTGFFPGLEPDPALPQSFQTAACDVMRNHVSDVLEFLSDVHTLSKVKSRYGGSSGNGASLVVVDVDVVVVVIVVAFAVAVVVDIIIIIIIDDVDVDDNDDDVVVM